MRCMGGDGHWCSSEEEAREPVSKSVHRSFSSDFPHLGFTHPSYDFHLGHGFLHGRRAGPDIDSPTIPTARRGRRDSDSDSSVHPGRGKEEEKEESEETQQGEGSYHLSRSTSHSNSYRRGKPAATFIYQQEQALEIHQFLPRSFSSLVRTRRC